MQQKEIIIKIRSY